MDRASRRPYWYLYTITSYSSVAEAARGTLWSLPRVLSVIDVGERQVPQASARPIYGSSVAQIPAAR
jgi:hypothetical protein